MEAGGIPEAVKGRNAAADTMDTVPDENSHSAGPLPHQGVKWLVTVDFVDTCHRQSARWFPSSCNINGGSVVALAQPKLRLTGFAGIVYTGSTGWERNAR